MSFPFFIINLRNLLLLYHKFLAILDVDALFGGLSYTAAHEVIDKARAFPRKGPPPMCRPPDVPRGP